MHTAPTPDQWAQALRRRDFPTLQAWLKVQPNGLDQALVVIETGQGIQAERPLVWAVNSQQWALANKLVSLGVNPNVLSIDGKHTVLEAVVATCGGLFTPWPPLVLELVENCLAHGGDPHARAQPINPAVLASCLSNAVHLSDASKKKTIDPVRRTIALRIWEATQDRAWPLPVQWATWFQVLRKENQAWVQRLKLCGSSPVLHDQTLETTMAAELGRDLLGDRPRLVAAFEILAEFGMEWRSAEHKPRDDELRQVFAAAKAARLDRKWHTEGMPVVRGKGRL